VGEGGKSAQGSPVGCSASRTRTILGPRRKPARGGEERGHGGGEGGEGGGGRGRAGRGRGREGEGAREGAREGEGEGGAGGACLIASGDGGGALVS
jgi:hypothetical protein